METTMAHRALVVLCIGSLTLDSSHSTPLVFPWSIRCIVAGQHRRLVPHDYVFTVGRPCKKPLSVLALAEPVIGSSLFARFSRST